MTSKRLNDLEQWDDSSYLYGERADGKQVRLSKAVAMKILGLKEARDAAQMAETNALIAADEAGEAELLVTQIKEQIAELVANPNADAELVAKVALNAASIALIQEQMKDRPKTVWMSEAEFDALTNNGENLAPIAAYEDLRVYEDTYTPEPSGEDATYDETTMLVEYDGIYDEESGLIEVDGIYDETTGLVTI